MKKSRKILIRFDDICPTMNWTLWQKAVSILEKYNIKPLIGVIPDCMDPDLLIDEARTDFWEYIKELQKKGYTVALHGLNHKFDKKCRGLVNSGVNTEFAGHSYEIQFEKIRKGKEILLNHGIETDVFFAPAHSYDKNTIRALKANGFKYMSDGKSKLAINYNGLIAIPCRASGVPKIRNLGYYTAVFHAHEWSREDKAFGYNQLVNLCEKYSSDIVTFDDYKKQRIGNKLIQIVDEKIYLLWIYKLKPVLRKVKRFF